MRAIKALWLWIQFVAAIALIVVVAGPYIVCLCIDDFFFARRDKAPRYIARLRACFE